MRYTLTSYVPIYPDDGNNAQKDICDMFRRGIESKFPEYSMCSGYPVRTDRVPRLVNPKQLELIHLRRCVRFSVESFRVAANRPADGRRIGQFKHFTKHVHALRRQRSSSGIFLSS